MELINAQVWSEKRVVGYSCQQLFKVVSEVQYDILFCNVLKVPHISVLVLISFPSKDPKILLVS